MRPHLANPVIVRPNPTSLFIRPKTIFRNFHNQPTFNITNKLQCLHIHKIISGLVVNSFTGRFCTISGSPWEKEDNLANSFNYKLSKLVDNGRYEEAEKLFDSMKRSSNLTSWHILLKCFSKQKKLDKIMKAISEMKSFNKTPNTTSFNTAINCCVKLGKLPEMFEIYHQMESEGVSPDAFTFNCMLKALHNSGDVSKFESLLGTMLVRLKISPNSETMQILLDHWASDGTPLTTIIELMNRMEKHFRIDASIHTALITALGKAHRVEDIESLQKGFKNSGVDVSKELPLAVIKAYGMNNKIDEAIDYFEKVASSTPPTLPLANAMLEALSGCNDATTLVNFFNSLDKYNLKPNIVSWELVISGLSHHPVLFNTVEEYLAMMEKDFKPTVRIFEAVIPYFLHCGAVEKSIQYFIKMINLDIVPRAYVLNEVMKHLADQGRWEEVSSLTQLISKYGTILDDASHNILLLSMGNAGKMQEMQSYFNKLLSQGFKPNTMTFNTMIKCCGKFGFIAFLLECLKMMEERHLKPDGFTLNHVLYTFLARGEYSRCLDLYKKLRNQGASPTQNCVTLIKKKLHSTRNATQPDLTALLELVERDLGKVGNNKPP